MASILVHDSALSSSQQLRNKQLVTEGFMWMTLYEWSVDRSFGLWMVGLTAVFSNRSYTMTTIFIKVPKNDKIDNQKSILVFYFTKVVLNWLKIWFSLIFEYFARCAGGRGGRGTQPMGVEGGWARTAAELWRRARDIVVAAHQL